MDRNNFNGKNSENMNTGYNSSLNQNKDSDSNQAPSEMNLRNKLNNAFSDLENLRKALKDIRSNNDSMVGGNNGHTKNKNSQKYDFFSDDRYNNVLSQIKQSNQDKSKHSKFTSSSREKLAANNSYSIYKMNKENNREDKTNSSLHLKNLDIPRHQNATNTTKSRKIDFMSALNSNKEHYNQTYSNEKNNFHQTPNNEYRKITTDSHNNSRNNLNNNNSNNTSNIYSTNNKYSYISLREEIERLKIANQVLLKSNTELKNENLTLNKELELQYQVNRNSLDNNHHNSLGTPFKRNSSRKTKIGDNEAFEVAEQQSQIMHQNFNELVDDLKSSLEVSKKHNAELSDLVEQTLKKNSELQKANQEAKEQTELAEKDIEKLNKAFEETKEIIKGFRGNIESLESELAEIRDEKRQLEEKLFMAEEQIINLISINEGHLKTKKDNLEVIESLKNTIEIIKRGGYSDEENIVETKIKLEEMENTINQKNYTIKTISDNITSFEKDREFFNLTLNNLKDEIADKDKFIEELEEKFRDLYADFEKSNMRAETLQVKLDESDQTISNLKTSINFINETMEEYKVDYDKVRAELESERSEKNKLVKNMETTKEKFSALTLEIEDLQESKDSLQKKIVEIDKELKEKKNVHKKVNFEKSNLEQQLQEAKNIIDTLKDEIKADKYAKLNEEFQHEIVKSNEERMKKIEELRAQIESKTKEIEVNNETYSENIRAKEDKIKELTKLLSRAENVNEQNEKNFSEKVSMLSNTIEQLKNEMQQVKYSFETEKQNGKYQIEEYQRQVKELQMRLQTSEENYSNLIKKNYESYQTVGTVPSKSYVTNSKSEFDYAGKSTVSTSAVNNYVSGASSANGFSSVAGNHYALNSGSANSNNFWSSVSANNAVTTSSVNEKNTVTTGNKYYSTSAATATSSAVNVKSNYEYGSSTVKSDLKTGLVSGSEFNHATAITNNNNSSVGQAGAATKYTYSSGTNKY